MVDSIYATLENRKVVLDRVRVPEIAAYIFVNRVVDGAVACVLFRWLLIDWRFVGHEVQRAVDLSEQNGLESLGSDVSDVE